MIDALPGARDVSYLEPLLPLTARILQRIENNWSEGERQRALGQKSTRQNLKIAALIPVYAILGMPEITGSMASYAIGGLIRGGKWK